MTKVTLQPIEEAEVHELLRFEQENRAHFERSVAGFGDDDYELEALKEITGTLKPGKPVTPTTTLSVT